MSRNTYAPILVLCCFIFIFVSCNKKEKESSSSANAGSNVEEMAVDMAKKHSPVNKTDAELIRNTIKNADNPEAIQKGREAYLRKTLGDEAYENHKKHKEAMLKGDFSHLRGDGKKTGKKDLESAKKLKKKARAENQKLLEAHQKKLEAIQAKRMAARNTKLTPSQRDKAKKLLLELCTKNKSDAVCKLKEKCDVSKDCSDFNKAVDNMAKMLVGRN